VNNKSVRDLMLDDQGNIAHIIERCAVMEGNYLRRDRSTTSRAEHDLEEALIALYASILRYQVLSCSYLKRSKFSKSGKNSNLGNSRNSLDKIPTNNCDRQRHFILCTIPVG
jgi:hypothetical protein